MLWVHWVKIEYDVLSDNDFASNHNLNQSPVELKLLCGADLLESFGVPDLWAPADVRLPVPKL